MMIIFPSISTRMPAHAPYRPPKIVVYDIYYSVVYVCDVIYDMVYWLSLQANSVHVCHGNKYI